MNIITVKITTDNGLRSFTSTIDTTDQLDGGAKLYEALVHAVMDLSENGPKEQYVATRKNIAGQSY